MPKESPEQIARFAAEMAQLSRRPEMRNFLTETEAKRQAAESDANDAEAERKKEEWLIESSRRYKLIAKWFHDEMSALAPAEWMEYEAEAVKEPHKALRKLRKAGWKMHARATMAAPEGCTPVPCTNCMILYQGAIQTGTRFVWAEIKSVKSNIIQVGQA